MFCSYNAANHTRWNLFTESYNRYSCYLRQIVGHFKRSPLAYNHLKIIQDRLQLTKHRIKQDVCTRWNSTLHMLQVILEQKMALAAYATEYGDVQQLNWKLLEKLLKYLVVLRR